MFIFVACFVYVSIEVYNSFDFYYQYLTTTEINKINKPEIPFPAVTICNFNRWETRHMWITTLFMPIHMLMHAYTCLYMPLHAYLLYPFLYKLIYAYTTYIDAYKSVYMFIHTFRCL